MYVLILRKFKRNKFTEIPLVVSRDLPYLGELINDENFRNLYFGPANRPESQLDVMYTDTLH